MLPRLLFHLLVEKGSCAGDDLAHRERRPQTFLNALRIG